MRSTHVISIPLRPNICRTPGRYGDFFIPDDDDLIANSIREYGEWAQQEIDILGAFIHTGNHIVDAGAYIGTHSRAFSALVGASGKVFAFEPNPATFSILQQNAEAATQSNIQLFNTGLGATSAETTLQIVESDHNRASASVAPAPNAKSIRIKIQPLDELAFSRVDFIKVDIEGMELQLLEGAEDTVQRHSPIIFLEVNSLHSSQGFLDWATQHNYLAYGINVPAFNADNHLQSSINIFGHAREVGLLLTPIDSQPVYKEALLDLNLPPINNLDDLALLLLHKPQYIENVLGNSNTCKYLGLSLPTHEKQKNNELMALHEAKDVALAEASQAYAQLKQAFNEKEAALIHLHGTLELQQKQLASCEAKDAAIANASQAYTSLRQAYDEKETALRHLYEKLKVQQDQLALCEAKDSALAQAAHAYAELRHAYDQKEKALVDLYEMLKAQQEHK